MKLILTQIKPETPDVVSFYFHPDKSLSWTPGQYLRYRLPHAEPDDRGFERYYTIASAPHEGHVQLTTRFAQNSSSFKQALMNLEVGARIEIDGGVSGEFTLTEPGRGEYVLIAGGIGVTPFRAILVDLAHRGVGAQIKLIYANRNSQIVFRDELDKIARAIRGLEIRYLVSPERITPGVIRSEVDDLARPLFYVSGPKPMVDAVQSMLIEEGVPPPHIKRDAFPGYD